MIVKPVYGSHRQGIVKCRRLADVQDRAYEFLRGCNDDEPFFVQQLVTIEREYRVMVLDGELLGMVQKRAGERHRDFVAARDDDVSDFVLNIVSQTGLLGVDVGVTEDGTIHIIEANRAPEWERFQVASGVDVATNLMEHLFQRVGVNYERFV